MIIVIAQRVPFPPNKGEKLRTYHHIKFLAQRGHTIQVMSLKHEDNDDVLAEQLANELGVVVELFPLAPKVIRYASAFLKNQAISVAAFYSKSLKNRLDSLANDVKPIDAVYLSASSLAHYAEPFVAEPRTSTHMDFMDVDSDKWGQYAESSKGLMRLIYRREQTKIKQLEISTAKQFNNTFLIAPAEIELFEKTVCASSKVTRLGNGMDFSAFYPSSENRLAAEPSFLFTGVMDYKPNIDAMVWFVEHCWDAILAELPDAKLVIAGMNPAPSISSLSNTRGINVTGFVEDILPYYHQAWTFVAPFRLARGVQNKVLQASACRVPIVTTSMGAEGISFANPLSMYFAEDASAFIKACVESIRDRDQAETKAQQAYLAITSTYSWEHQLQPLFEAIES